MSMLARYKKKGGVMELVKLIESSSEPKRSSLLRMVRTEDASFANEVESKILVFEKLKTQPESVIAEIVGAMPPKYLALALFGETPEFIALCEKCLGKNFNNFKTERDALVGTEVPPAQIESGQRKMISEARKLESAGSIKLVFAPGVALPTAEVLSVKTEERNSIEAPQQPGLSSPPPQSEVLKNLVDQGSNSSGPPPLSAFNMEAPPAGLIGERLENFIKQNLGV